MAKETVSLSGVLSGLILEKNVLSTQDVIGVVCCGFTALTVHDSVMSVFPCNAKHAHDSQYICAAPLSVHGEYSSAS